MTEAMPLGQVLPGTMPHSLEAEAALLGGLLLDNEVLGRVANLEPVAFYQPFHRDVFGTILRIARAGDAFDVVTVFDAMRAGGQVGDDGLARLHELAQFVPGAAALRRHAAIVSARHQQRQLMRAGAEIIEIAGAQAPPAELIDKAQMILARLSVAKSRREPQHVTASLAEYLKLLEELSEGKNPAIATGIHGLDRLLNGGLRRGELLVLGARPKHGKTAVSLAIARAMARQYGVLFLSQEMPISQLVHRHTAAEGSIDLGRILRADPKADEMWVAVTLAAERLGGLRLVHDDQAALSLLDIRRKAIKVRREHGLDVLFVDFLQLMAGGGEENSNRELDITANGLKALAMDLNVAVTAPVTYDDIVRKA